MNQAMFKAGALLVAGIFAVETIVQPGTASAQSITHLLNLPSASGLVSVSEKFSPVMARGLKFNPQDGLSMSLIVDSGDEHVSGDQLRRESEKLIKYFLTALAVPEKDLWVNLSPYEKDRITSDALANTAMGEDLLAQDYILKKITASLLDPDGEDGKAFWEKIHTRMYDAYGRVDVPVDTFHKIWIMPAKAEVFAQGDTVLILDSQLKVMLEEDYLAIGEQRLADSKDEENNSNRYSLFANRSDVKDILRDVILPVIAEEVNHGKNFAPLRQIFHALILARWYKDNLKQSILGQVYADRSKVSGIDQDNTQSLEMIYNRYLDAFKSGAEGLIKEEYDSFTQSMSTRKYVTGGFQNNLAMMTMVRQPMRQTAQRFLPLIVGGISEAQFDIQVEGADGAMMNRRDFSLKTLLTFFGLMILPPRLWGREEREGVFERSPFYQMAQDFIPKAVETLQNLFNDYYAALEGGMSIFKDQLNGIPASQEEVGRYSAAQQKAISDFLGMGDLFEADSTEFESYVEKIESYLRTHGYFFTVKTQYYIPLSSGEIVSSEIYDVTLRPVISGKTQTDNISGEDVTFEEVILGPEMITKPSFIKQTIEHARPGVVYLMPDEYQKTGEAWYDLLSRKTKGTEQEYRLIELQFGDAFGDTFRSRMERDSFVSYSADLLRQHAYISALQRVHDFEHEKQQTAADAEARALLRGMIDGLPYVSLYRLSLFVRIRDAQLAFSGTLVSPEAQVADRLYLLFNYAVKDDKDVFETFMTDGRGFEVFSGKSSLELNTRLDAFKKGGIFAQFSFESKVHFLNLSLLEGFPWSYGAGSIAHQNYVSMLSKDELDVFKGILGTGFNKDNKKLQEDRWRILKSSSKSKPSKPGSDRAMMTNYNLEIARLTAIRNGNIPGDKEDAQKRLMEISRLTMKEVEEETNNRIVDRPTYAKTVFKLNKSNNAQLSAMPGQTTSTGGVDLNTSGMDFKSGGRVDGFVMKNMLNINPDDVIGVVPVNIIITPIKNVNMLLGLDSEEEQEPFGERHELSDALAGREKAI